MLKTLTHKEFQLLIFKEMSKIIEKMLDVSKLKGSISKDNGN